MSPGDTTSDVKQDRTAEIYKAARQFPLCPFYDTMHLSSEAHAVPAWCLSA
jgi:hypothetical protein